MVTTPKEIDALSSLRGMVRQSRQRSCIGLGLDWLPPFWHVPTLVLLVPWNTAFFLYKYKNGRIELMAEAVLGSSLRCALSNLVKPLHDRHRLYLRSYGKPYAA